MARTNLKGISGYFYYYKSQVATVCCLVVNADEVKQFLPFVANRQSRQMFYMPSSLFNYYNPYGAQIMVPTAQGQIQPEFLSSGKLTETHPGLFSSQLNFWWYFPMTCSWCIFLMVKGGSELAPMEKIFNQNEDISLTPAATGKAMFY